MLRLQQQFLPFTNFVQTPPAHRISGVGFWDSTGRYHPNRLGDHDSPEDLSVPRPELVDPRLQKDLCDEFEEFLASVHTAPVTNYIKDVNIQADCDKGVDLWEKTCAEEHKIKSEEEKSQVVEIIDITDSSDAEDVTNKPALNNSKVKELLLTPHTDQKPDNSEESQSDVKKPSATSELAKLLSCTNNKKISNDEGEKEEETKPAVSNPQRKRLNGSDVTMPTEPVVKLKEATVILNRINIKQYLNKKLRRRTVSDTESTENNKEIRYPVVDKPPQGSFPLQDKNPRVETKRERSVECKKSVKKGSERRKSGRRKKRPVKKSCDKVKDTKWHIPKNNNFSAKTYDQLLKRPMVILEKLSLESERVIKSLLAGVPGLNDLQLIQPEDNDRVVQVVQVSGGRPTSTVTSQNTQTSTQITPHIQRVGQPRNDKPPGSVSENSEPPAVTSTAPEKPARSQPSTLINILSHQVITPAQTRSNRINILSHHLINPPTVVETTAKSNATTSQVSYRVYAQFCNCIKTFFRLVTNK